MNYEYLYFVVACMLMLPLLLLRAAAAVLRVIQIDENIFHLYKFHIRARLTRGLINSSDLCRLHLSVLLLHFQKGISIVFHNCVLTKCHFKALHAISLFYTHTHTPVRQPNDARYSSFNFAKNITQTRHCVAKMCEKVKMRRIKSDIGIFFVFKKGFIEYDKR